MNDWRSIDQQKTDQKQLEENCEKQIDEIFKTINSDQAEYDKQLLTLSSGFLAVSLAFIKDVVPLKDAAFLALLYISFCSLAACIMLVLFSYQYSISGNFKAKAYWEERRDGNLKIKFPMKHAENIKRINRLSGFLFGAGVLLLVLFVIINLHQEVKVSATNRGIANDGALLRVPPSNQGEERGSHIKVPTAPPTTNTNPKNDGGNNQSKKQ